MAVIPEVVEVLVDNMFRGTDNGGIDFIGMGIVILSITSLIEIEV